MKVVQQWSLGPKYRIKHNLTTTWLNVLTCQEECADQKRGVVSHRAWTTEANTHIGAHPDADPEQTLVYSAGLIDGGDGPSWLSEPTYIH